MLEKGYPKKKKKRRGKRRGGKALTQIGLMDRQGGRKEQLLQGRPQVGTASLCIVPGEGALVST